jgi:hypothetical protein
MRASSSLGLVPVATPSVAGHLWTSYPAYSPAVYHHASTPPWWLFGVNRITVTTTCGKLLKHPQPTHATQHFPPWIHPTSHPLPRRHPQPIPFLTPTAPQATYSKGSQDFHPPPLLPLTCRPPPTLDILLATLPEPPNSVTHIVCSPPVCGVHSDIKSSITIGHDMSLVNRMVDSGSKVCVTGNLGNLLDVVDIVPITILVALEGTSATYDDYITKRGLLPLSLSDGSLYYQPCFYCTNMVEIIISPATVLALSSVIFSWSQEGFKDPTLAGSLRFTSHDGLLSMFFLLQC